MRSLPGRWLAAVAALPITLFTLTGLVPLPVQAATGVTASADPGGTGTPDRFALGLALVALGLLIVAITVVRLRIQSRHRRMPQPAVSRSSRVSDSWEAGWVTSSRRSSARSRS